MAVATLPTMLRTLGAGLRTVLLAPAFLGYTMYISAKVNRLAKQAPNHDAINEIAENWTKRFTEIPPITIAVEGTEHIDSDRQYIVVSNHQSNFDIPVAVQALDPLRTRFISKIEVSKIPIFGKAAINAGVVMLDREAARANHEHLNQEVAKSLAAGHSILLFAEGTRSRTGEMGKFRRGAARLALAAGVDILPVVIHGTRDVNPPGSLVIYPGEVTVRILPPVSMEGVTSQNVREVTDDLREQIVKHHAEMSDKQYQS